MRILLVSDFYPPVSGGLEVHVAALATELSNQGATVRVATLTNNPDQSDDRVRVHTIRALSTSLLPHEDVNRPFHPPVPDPMARRGLKEIIREFSPDVIHGHSLMAISLPRSRPPLVFTAHDYALICELRTLRHRHDLVCDGPETIKCVSCASETYGSVKALLLTPATAVGRHLLAPDAVIAVSNAVAKKLTASIKVHIDSITNFVSDTVESAPLSSGRLPDGKFVMFAGDPGTHKGVQHLIDIWVAEPQPEAELLLCTTRPMAHPAGSRIRVVTLTRAEVATAWESAYVAAVPSLWAEPCPTVALEAMRAGVPVIAYDAGGIPELVRDGLDGYIVTMGDTAALRGRINELIANPRLRDQMSASARSRAKLYKASVVVPRIMSVYDRLVGLDG